MMRSIPESDWKLFRQLHPLAFDRYCQQVLIDIALIAADAKEPPHQRYMEIYQVILQRDRTIQATFNDLRRSTALMQLITMHSHGLVSEEEISRFTQETRDAITCHRRLFP